MAGIVKKLLLGASLVASAGAIATAPASAASLTNATIGGTNPGDYYLYDVSGKSSSLVPNNQANLNKVLGGDATSPTGNVELARSSETGGFTFSKNTTLTGDIGGKSITLSSLTALDWFGPTLNTAYGASNLATKWFNEFITKAGYGLAVGTPVAWNMYNSFFGLKGFQASSDPNISYVNQDDNTGEIKIGLAGHYDLKAFYSNPNSPFSLFANYLPTGFQASEVVKYTYNGVTDYLYSFSATNTGFATSDGSSHSGNYEVKIAGVPPTTSVPEPSTMLGLMAVGGLLVAKGKLKKAA